MRVDFIYGTRPELIKMAMPIKAFQAAPGLTVRVISTGQHREMLNVMEKWFDITPDVNLEVMQSNQTLASLSARILERLDEFYVREGPPEIVIVQGDTTSAMMAGFVGFYHKSKVAHVEAGLRTHNKYSPWPEEMNRVVLSRLADFHFAPTKVNQANLLKEGVAGEAILVTGNTVIDALHYSMQRVNTEGIYPPELQNLYQGAQAESRVVLITGHRRENFGRGFESICLAIKELARLFPDVYFIYPVHLNPRVQEPVREILNVEQVPNVKLISPQGYPQFISLMQRCYLVLTDSGGVQEEAPGLGKPVLVMRDNTERPEAIETGIVKLVGAGQGRIVKEVTLLLTDSSAYERMAHAANPYGDGHASEMMLQKIKSLEGQV
jgi:UDP-N-acetylglucosamine 2-epimerase (non-hydrolysing)